MVAPEVVGLVAFVGGVAVTLAFIRLTAPKSRSAERRTMARPDLPESQPQHDAYRVIREHVNGNREITSTDLLFHGPDGRAAKQAFEAAVSSGGAGSLQFWHGDVCRSVVEFG